MKKFMVTVLAAIIGSFGYIVVDQSVEDRMTVLEEQVHELQEQNSSLAEKSSVYDEIHSQLEAQHSELRTQLEDVSSEAVGLREEYVELSSRLDSDKNSRTRFIYPAGFESRLMPDIYRTSYGGYCVDFDITEYKIKGGKEIYLSPNGNDANPGTKDAPKRTFKAAFAVSDCTTVYLLEGTYTYGEHFTSAHDLSGKNLIGIGNVYIDNNGGSCLHTSSTAYLENLDISGSGRCFYATLGADESLYLYKCTLHDSTSNNALTVTGGNVWLVECETYNAALDGFNYHKNDDENAVTCAVEINCRAYNIGNSSNHSCNASTMHDGGSVIRIGGEYEGCHGGNIADTGTNDQLLSYSLNLGVYSHGSTQSNAQYPEFNCSFWARYTNMWLYDCQTHSSTYDITALSHSSVYTTGLNSDKLFGSATNYVDQKSSITEK